MILERSQGLSNRLWDRDQRQIHFRPYLAQSSQNLLASPAKPFFITKLNQGSSSTSSSKSHVGTFVLSKVPMALPSNLCCAVFSSAYCRMLVLRDARPHSRRSTLPIRQYLELCPTEIVSTKTTIMLSCFISLVVCGLCRSDSPNQAHERPAHRLLPSTSPKRLLSSGHNSSLPRLHAS